jgi:hypothetical protein
MQIVDNKFIKRVLRGLTKDEKALIMLALMLSKPPQDLVEKLIPLQPLPLPKAQIFYLDKIVTKKVKSYGKCKKRKTKVK